MKGKEMMRYGRRITLMTALLLLWSAYVMAEGLFTVEDGLVRGGTETTDGFELLLELPVPEAEFEEELPRMTAQRYKADTGQLERVWKVYASLNGAPELEEAQIFVDLDGRVTSQYVYSDRATEMPFQIVGIDPPYRRQDEVLEDLDKEAIARCVLSDLGIEVEYPLYYVAAGSVDYSNEREERAFIRDTDTVFIARRMIEGYPLVTGDPAFMHDGTVYTGGHIAIVLDERNNLAYLNIWNITNGVKREGKGIPCISWQAALKQFLRCKRDFQFETFDERRVSSVSPGRMTITDASPALIYAEKTGMITPVWQIDGTLEFEQVMPDGTINPIRRMLQYYIDAWTGEYLCADP